MKTSILQGTYDTRNRLTNIGTASYSYNAENRRTSVTENGKTSKFVINPNTRLDQVLMETDDQGHPLTYYVYGLGLISQENIEGNISYYHYDRRGSTIALTNETGIVTDNYKYDFYGEILSKQGTTSNRFLYNGKYGVMTDSNGLYYMRTRFYNPEIKRFINRDVLSGDISNPQTFNRYAYVNGNPVSFIDPFGLSREEAQNTMKGIQIFLYDHENIITPIIGISTKTGLYDTVDAFNGDPTGLIIDIVSIAAPEAQLTKFLKPVISPLAKSSVKVLGKVVKSQRGQTTFTGDVFLRKLKELRNKAPQVSGNKAKGELGEEYADTVFESLGYEKLSSKVGSNNGFDGVFIKRDIHGNIEDIVINESKFGSSSFGKTAQGFRQMDSNWINMNITKMLDSDDPLVKEAGEILENNRHLIRTKLNRLTKDGKNKWKSNPNGWGK